MLIIEFIRKRDERFIPAVITCFLSANQQNCRSSWVKGVKNPVWLSFVLHSQFSHLTMPRPFMSEQWGNGRCGPNSSSNLTVTSIESCSSSVSPSHHWPNSSVNSTSQLINNYNP